MHRARDAQEEGVVWHVLSAARGVRVVKRSKRGVWRVKNAGSVRDAVNAARGAHNVINARVFLFEDGLHARCVVNNTHRFGRSFDVIKDGTNA